MDKKYSVVIKPTVARKLLKAGKGYQIVDIKPRKQNDGTTDFTRCVFVFEWKQGLDEDIQFYINQLNKGN
jgi:hypothetical protein